VATVKSLEAAIVRLVEVVGINDAHKAEILETLGVEEKTEETPTE
jgi:hypothetical protein